MTKLNRHSISPELLEEVFERFYCLGWRENTDAFRRKRLAEMLIARLNGYPLPRSGFSMIAELRLMHGRNLNQSGRVLLYEAFVQPNRV